jgi:cyclophilin family peptidyl-prolyl cis-trans isomerase
MPPADKRARKKENARAAREQREAALKRKKRMKSSITIGVITALFVGLIVILSATGGKDKKKSASKTTTPPTTVPAVPADPLLDSAQTYTATIATNFGNITVKLDAKNAPIGAAHFANLANKGVYNGSRWHRIIKDFVIQGGAPGGDLSKSYGTSVVAELPKQYKLGDLAAAKTGNDPSGTFDSQFFIVTGSQGEALPSDYADFGTVTAGMDVVRKIEALETGANDEPTAKATIDKITISTSDQPGVTTSSSATSAPSVSTSTTAPAR